MREPVLGFHVGPCMTLTTAPRQTCGCTGHTVETCITTGNRRWRSAASPREISSHVSWTWRLEPSLSARTERWPQNSPTQAVKKKKNQKVQPVFNWWLIIEQEPKLAFEDVDATELYPCVMFYSSNPGEKVRQHQYSPTWELNSSLFTTKTRSLFWTGWYKIFLIRHYFALFVGIKLKL